MSKIKVSEEVKAIMEHYGYEAQREQFVEECAEAIQAVQKCKRSHCSKEAHENLQEEVADVIIMASQMYTFLGADEIDKIITNKVTRQIERIRSEEKC